MVAGDRWRRGRVTAGLLAGLVGSQLWEGEGSGGRGVGRRSPHLSRSGEKWPNTPVPTPSRQEDGVNIWTHFSFSCWRCFPGVAPAVLGPEASSADPGGPPPGLDVTVLATPSEASPQEPKLIGTDVSEVPSGPENELVPDDPASAGTEVPEEDHKPVLDAEEEVVVEDVLSKTIPDDVDVSVTAIEDVSPESEEPLSETVAKEFITGSTSVVLAKPTMESSEEANLVEATGQEVTEAPPGDATHHIQATAGTAEEPSEITRTGPESSDVDEGNRPAEAPSEHPLDGTRTRTSPSEAPALMVPAGEFEDNEIVLGVTPDPVPNTEVTTQGWVLTTSEQTSVDKVTSGASTEDAAEETPNASDDEGEGKEETPEEREDGVAQEMTITGPPEEAAAKPSRTPASEQEPEEETVEEGEPAEEPTKEADGPEELLEESARAGGKPEKEPDFVEEGPKKTKENVPSEASQQEPVVEDETGPVIPSAPLKDPEVTIAKVDEDDVAETEEEGSPPDTVTSEETTTEADRAEGLLPGSGVEETSEPEEEVPVNLDEEVPPEATESTEVVEPTSEVLDSFPDSEQEPVPSAPPEVVPHPAEGEASQLDEISPEGPREPVLNTSPVSPTEILPKEVEVASSDDTPATPKYVVEYNNGNFPDLPEGPFGGDEGLLVNNGFDLDGEEENSVRSLGSSADAVSGEVTRPSCPQIGNEIDDRLLWPPKSLKDQMVEMTLKLRGETYNDALRDRSSVHYQQLARHFTRRVRWLAQGPTSRPGSGLSSARSDTQFLEVPPSPEEPFGFTLRYSLLSC